MALTQFQLVYSAREDRALLRIELDGGDAYRLWLTRAMTQALLVRASRLRAGAPHTAAALDLAMQQPAHTLAMLRDPRSAAVRATGCPLGDEPVLLDSINLRFAPQGVFCTLGVRGHFQLHLELPWNFFKHWMLMLENMDEEADWQLMPCLAETLGPDAVGEVLAFAAVGRTQVPHAKHRSHPGTKAP
jgi:hypothetical protein